MLQGQSQHCANVVPTLCQHCATVSMVLKSALAKQMLDALLHLGGGLAQSFSQAAYTVAEAVHDTMGSATHAH